MTVEYVLLVSLFVYLLFEAMTATPMKTFEDYGPRLGARIEKQLMTGDGFTQKGAGLKWE